MRRRASYDWTGEIVRRRYRRVRVAKLAALIAFIGLLSLLASPAR
jgi:hypothetical protein